MGAINLVVCCLLYFLRCGLSSVSTIDSVEPEYLDMLLETEQYEEFSKLLQIDDVDLVRPSKGNQTHDPTFNKGLEHGDILFRPWQLEESRQGLNMKRYPTSKWKNNVVPYSISMRSYTILQYVGIRSAINNWNSKFSEIKFRSRRRGEKDYVLFFNGKGCYANFGRVGGQQPISIQSNGCLRTGTIHHEMMHSIGISHEHDRPDRDSYIRVLFENIPKDWKSQYEKTDSRDFDILGKYDYYSIMHYPIPAPETGKPAFEVLQKNVNLTRIGQRSKMTDIDEMKIKKLYS